MTQTKRGSFIEACVNTLIGFLISLAANPLICWLLGVKMHLSQMSGYVLFFTILSIARSYVIRRFFNGNIFQSIKNKYEPNSSFNR